MSSPPAGGGAEEEAGPADQADAAPPRPPPPSLPTPRHPARVAAAQLTSTADVDANYAACARLAAAAVQAGCSMLFLPEACAFLGPNPAATAAAAQPLDGPLLARYRALAARTGLWLSLGGFQEAGGPPLRSEAGTGSPPPPPRCFNTHVVLDAAGGTVAAYRKVHLFDAEGLAESAGTAPGGVGRVVAAGTPVGDVGLAVCFDLRFARFFDALVFGGEEEEGTGGEGGPQDGPAHAARVLAIPAAFTVPTGAAHWEVLLRARAIETQCAVVAAAQAGAHSATRASYGHALITDAWGTVLARVGGPAPDDAAALAAEGLAVADLGEGTVEEVRARMPLAAARARGRAAMGL